MKHTRRISAVLLTLLACFTFVPAVWAHPLGNFTVNQYTALHISREAIVIDYVLDMAEIPAFQEISFFDANGNGQADASEAQAYHAPKCAWILPNMSLRLNGQPVNITLKSSAVEFPAGVGGLPTLRLTCEFHAPLASSTENISLSFSNSAYPEQPGWKELLVIPDGVKIQGEYVSTSLSKRLTEYPQDLLSDPLKQMQVDVEIIPGALPAQSNFPATTQSSLTPLDRNDAFTRLILLEELTVSTVLIALFISVLWGAMHAMTPGHGKTIVGAYLVGSRGTVKHALYLGLTTTITHTLGVFALGLITLFAAEYVVPERLFPWITLLSGLFVVGIGVNLFLQRFKSSSLSSWLGTLAAKRVRLQPAYSPSLQRIQIQDTNPKRFVMTTTHEHGHEHVHPHVHDHAHDHHHDHHEHHHVHSDHSHTPPEAITWRSILALGVSGGLLPCPSALVVLLGAIALNRIGFGLILVFAFSLGLAGALTAIGILFIYAGKIFERFPSSGKLLGVLPVFSALFISLIGLGILYRAWLEIF